MAKQKETQGSTTSQQQGSQGTQAIQTNTGQRQQQGSQQTGISRYNQSQPSSWLASSPFSFMRRFSEEMDRLFEDFGMGRGWLSSPSFGRNLFQSNWGEMGQSVWSPQVELFERDNQLVIRADLPGLTKDDVKVEINDDQIILSGERRKEHEEKGEGYYRSERSYGSFYRSIPLPEGVNAEDAQATFRNGVLEITMQAPQRQPRGRRLEIRDASEGGEQQQQSHAKAAGQSR